MKHYFLIGYTFFSMVGCAATPEAKKEEAPKAEAAKVEKPKPITFVEEPKPLFEVDPQTLAVTFDKKVDPKKVIAQLAKAWAQAANAANQCGQQLQELKK